MAISIYGVETLFKGAMEPLLLMMGLILIILGFLLLSLVLLSGEVSGGGLILIGPFPIFFGGKNLNFLAILILALFIIFFLVFFMGVALSAGT